MKTLMKIITEKVAFKNYFKIFKNLNLCYYVVHKMHHVKLLAFIK